MDIAMTLGEIEREIQRIVDMDGKLLTRKDVERLRALLKKREKMTTVVYHYNRKPFTSRKVI